jgi:hypothetical protein
MRWLQLNDFHIGGARGPQRILLKSMLEAVEAACEADSRTIDLVFLVGDIAYSGKKEEYDRFVEDFLDPLKSSKWCSGATYFSVPGNHDVNCDAALAFPWQSIAQRHKDLFFQEDNDGKRARLSRVEIFRAYWDFVTSNGLIGPNPFEEVSIIHSDDTLPVDILATNTAFFSDRDEDSSKPITPAPLASLRHLIPSGSPSKPFLILGHHPISCFTRDHQAPFKTILREKKALFLHGHEHDPKASFDHQGCAQSIGFGASYLASSDVQSEGPWQNSFTICDLDVDLTIRAFTWQHPGKWIDTTSICFADCINEHGVAKVRIPSSGASSAIVAPVKTAARAKPVISKVLPLSTMSRKVWERLHPLSDNVRKLLKRDSFSKRDTTSVDGKLLTAIDTKNQLDLLISISGINHVLSSKEIESFNTELDTTDYESITVISLGRITDEAKTMYTRLRTRKSIEVLTNFELCGSVEKVLSIAQQTAWAELDAGLHAVQVILGVDDIYLVVIAKGVVGASFHLIDKDGSIIPQTDDTVIQLRRDFSDFSDITYKGGAGASGGSTRQSFDKPGYLAACYKEYNVLKYAALASVGIRFADLPLEELYVEATASEVHNGVSNKFEELVSDHVAAIPATDALKEQLQKQLLQTVEGGNRPEVSMAREYCKKYPTILITGDPGSGKSCFLKSEILSYCRASVENASKDKDERVWYENHIPVMVQLSELVAEKEFSLEKIYEAISALLERRGLPFPAADIETLSSEGRIAWFFDGLDEVVSIEKRSLVVKHINSIVERHVPVGCRVVVTSRPAAVHVVNLLPSLHKLELQGLSDTEIYNLAARILSFKIKDDDQGVILDEMPARKGQNQLINQLIADCKSNPGVGRLARNPLLLTLLIMIYANSGAPSAKRHRIYQDAIQTLASVRRREAGHQPISVQDLKMRLGAVAISVYRRSSGLLPSRKEVRKIVQEVMSNQRGGEEVSPGAANEFIQRVAESTGLITADARPGENDDAGVVAFMHHSFLEYFAAVGLSQSLEHEDFAALVNEPRWHEILTLLSGIIGDNQDIAPIIERILTATAVGVETNARLLLFAMDCALECDVPSEAAQRLIGQSIKNCIEQEAGRVDPWIRKEIGTRLAKLLHACGGVELNTILVGFIKSEDPAIAAAGIALAGYACAEGHDSNDIQTATSNACTSPDECVQVAICAAAATASLLRSEPVLQAIGRSLKKSVRLRRAGFRAISEIPGMPASQWSEIINGIDDEDLRVSNLASGAAIRAGLDIGLFTLDSSRKDVLVRAFKQLNERILTPVDISSKIDSDNAYRLLDSPRRQDRLIGIQLLAHSNSDPKEIHDYLVAIIEKGEDREEIVAAFNAIRSSEATLDLVTQGDLLLIKGCLEGGSSDVRIGAAKLLGCFTTDPVAMESLLHAKFSELSDKEFSVRVRMLSHARTNKDQVLSLFVDEIRKTLRPGQKLGRSGNDRLGSLLQAARNLGETCPADVCGLIRQAIDDFRLDIKIRGKALACYPAVAMPSSTVVKDLVAILQRQGFGVEQQLAQVVASFAKNCRRNIEFVSACIDSLPLLRDAALELHRRFRVRPISEKVENLVTELRRGIEEVSEILMAFEELDHSH